MPGNLQRQISGTLAAELPDPPAVPKAKVGILPLGVEPPARIRQERPNIREGPGGIEKVPFRKLLNPVQRGERKARRVLCGLRDQVGVVQFFSGRHEDGTKQMPVPAPSE